MLKKIFLTIFVITSFGLLCLGWWQGSGNLLSSGQSLLALGRLAGLLAVYTILWEFILAGRISWLEKIISLDKSLALHHWIGFVALTCIIMHPVFLGLAYSQLSGNGFWQQEISFLTGWEDMAGAFISVLLFTVAVIVSIKLIKKGIKYEWWYLVHLSIYAAVLLAFGHQLDSGGDFIGHRWFQFYWLALYGVMLGAFLFYRWLKPLKQFFQHRFYVEKIIAESDNVYSIYINGRDLSKYKFQSGQFAILRFFARGYWHESHPFSYSLESNSTHLRFTIKHLGDFTTKARNLPIGTKVFIDGQHGGMTADSCCHNNCLLIAGGIGITPLRALIINLLKQNKKVTLLYSQKNTEATVFKNELDRLSNLQVCYFDGEKTKINQESLKPYLDQSTDYYLCGPWLMVKSLRQIILQSGVSTKNIHFEKFSF